MILNIATNEDLDVFGELYCRILNGVYKNLNPFSPIIGKKFIVYPFILGDKPEMEIPESIEAMEDKLHYPMHLMTV